MRRYECLFILLLVLLTFGCRRSPNVPTFFSISDYDLDTIIARGTIRVVSDYNSVDYMMHKGQPIGYQYEIAKIYASERGLQLEMQACNDPSQARTRLLNGLSDVWAASLLVDSSDWSTDIRYTESYSESRMVLVSADKIDINAPLPDSVWVQEGSYEEELAMQIADTCGWTVVRVPYYDIEQIVQLVGERDIPRAIAPENIVKANVWYYPTIDYSLKLTEMRDMAWAVRPTSIALAQDLSDWIREFKKTPKFSQIYRRYMVDARSEQVSSKNVSEETYSDAFEDMVIKYLPEEDHRIDLALIQSLIYQESHFNPNAKSWVGAQGLMQLMPETATRFGCNDLSDPEESIKAGIEFLIWLDQRLIRYVPNSKDRLPFSLAAYNVGLGHVMDAIRLARKFERDTAKWEGSVEQAILLKSNPTIISDNQTVQHGYCRGTETVSYVKQIMQRARNYRKYLKERPDKIEVVEDLAEDEDDDDEPATEEEEKENNEAEEPIEPTPQQ